MKAVAVTFRIILKVVIFVTMIVVGLMLVNVLLPVLYPAALLLGVLVLMRFFWRILTPRPRSCETCAAASMRRLHGTLK